MKWYISYFYQVRNLDSKVIPMSTAIWDPKWYHNFKGNSFTFRDKKGVLNGLRCEKLMPTEVYDASSDCPSDGAKSCMHKSEAGWCNYLTKYYNYLKGLDFDDFRRSTEELCKDIDEDCEGVCLLVHEAFDNPCSEREPLLKWFEENGIELIQFGKKDNNK